MGRLRNMLLSLTMIVMLAGCESKDSRKYLRQSSNSNGESVRSTESRGFVVSSYEKRFANDGGWSRQEAEQRVKHQRYEEARYHGMNDIMKNQFINMERLGEEGRREMAQEYGSYQKFIEHGGGGNFQVISETHCNKCYRHANDMIDLP